MKTAIKTALNRFLIMNDLQPLKAKKNLLFYNADHKNLPWWKPENGTLYFGESLKKEGKIYEIVSLKSKGNHTLYYKVYSL